MRRDDERRDSTQEIHAELDHVYPHDGAQAADPGVDHRDDADRENAGSEAPLRDDGEWDGRGEDPDAVGEGARQQKYARRGAPGAPPEPPLQSLIRGVLGPLEIAGEQERGDDGDVEGSHQDRSTKSPRRARAWNADQKGANGLTP